MEQVQLVMLEAEHLDDETLLNKLPNITPDEVKDILKRRDEQDAERLMQYNMTNQNDNSENEEGNGNNRNENGNG